MNGEDRHDLFQRFELIIAKSGSHCELPPSRSIRSQRSDPILSENHFERDRRARAREIVASALRLVRDTCGTDVLRDAYGLTPSNRREGLLSMAARLDLAGLLFADVQRNDIYNFNAIATEATAVAAGDMPVLFDRLPGRRIAHRLYSAKLEALRWDAWLDRYGINVAERHAAIVDAYKESSWDTISRWREPLCQKWGEDVIANRLKKDRDDAAKGFRMWIMAPNETWENELIRCGSRYYEIKTGVSD